MVNRLFVLERYDDSGGHDPVQAFPCLPSGMRVACVVQLPADDVVLAIVEGEDEASVCDAVNAAGWRVDRIMAATWAQVSSRSERRDELAGHAAPRVRDVHGEVGAP